MCSCGSKTTAAAPRTFTHTYTDENGVKHTQSYSSEMDARLAASRLGGTVK
jgi:hypothetical protein